MISTCLVLAGEDTGQGGKLSMVGEDTHHGCKG